MNHFARAAVAAALFALVAGCPLTSPPPVTSSSSGDAASSSSGVGGGGPTVPVCIEPHLHTADYSCTTTSDCNTSDLYCHVFTCTAEHLCAYVVAQNGDGCDPPGGGSWVCQGGACCPRAVLPGPL